MNDLLTRGAQALGVELDDAAAEKLLLYKDFLLEYNKKVNLTAITDGAEFVTKHLLDCLTLIPHISHGARVIDVGTGGGLPGMVLKIARPDLEMTMLDARAKKLRFVDEAITLLGLEGARTMHGRAEDVARAKDRYDYAVSRAVAAMDKLSAWCLPLVRRGGHFIAMKGPNFHKELDEAAATIKRHTATIKNIIELTLPDEDISRSIIIIAKA